MTREERDRLYRTMARYLVDGMLFDAQVHARRRAYERRREEYIRVHRELVRRNVALLVLMCAVLASALWVSM